jgi:Meiotically Up-regulated Gene 113 (MUG113) protein
MRTRQEIVEEIKRTAKKNGGKPLGTNRFEKETGIKPYDWGQYWARFSDAQKEAGFAPNQLQGAHPDEFLIKKIISLARKLEKFPTSREIRLERSTDAEFPSMDAFNRLGVKDQLVAKTMEYCEANDGYDDVVGLCRAMLKEPKEEENGNDDNINIGEVYLFKSGRYYKVGKTTDTVRRGSELRIQLPEKLDLIYSIKTDDPSGVEAYWHRRFETKRMNGEWFDLSSADIRAFKRWRRIY